MRVPVVVMGVSGVGKTTIGAALADRLGREFIDADDLHPEVNRQKMHGGTPLTDADREPWLRSVGIVMRDRLRVGEPPVVACSALRFRYREILRSACPETVFLHLDGESRLISERLGARTHEYMPASLLRSQLDTLEPPTADELATRIDIAAPIDRIAERAQAWVAGIENAPRRLENAR